MSMASPSTYNRQALGKIWNLLDLPVEWPGYQILLQGDLDQDLVIEEEELHEIDWIAFSEAVEDFQEQVGLVPPDAKLGPITLKRLREHYDLTPSRAEVLKRLGPELEFKAAEVPVSEPPGPPLVGHTLEERSICTLWNKYGKAIAQQASHYTIPVETALAVFFVESKTAYDPATGLVIIRFEPHIFTRKSGQATSFRRGGQREEWDNLERAYEVDAEAALLSTSYGLPQLMGFNWPVTRHPGVRDMVLAFQRSCEEQVAGFFGFVEKNNLIPFIKQQDWRAFTRRYNGPGNVEDYSGKLVRALKVVNALKQDGARFAV
jgi:hypothetical protein